MKAGAVDFSLLGGFDQVGLSLKIEFVGGFEEVEDFRWDFAVVISGSWSE